MLMQVTENCAESCGVQVDGEVDTVTREFVHRFTFPPGAELVLRSRKTEVGICLVTFAPDAPEWSVNCPLCGKGIVVGQGA
jgi:hypothetical protein